MVLLNAKSPGTGIEFCFETRLGAGVSETLRSLMGVHNLLLCYRELTTALAAESSAEEATGACAEALALLEDVAGKAASRAPVSLPELLTSLRQVEEVLAALPNGLPHPARATLDSLHSATAQAEQGGTDVACPGHTLWFGKKAMQPGMQLKDYLGANEKTRAVVKLQPIGAGAPPREPMLDPETQQAMTAWYSRKQQEQQRMAAEDCGHVDNPAWARTDSLKKHVVGLPSSIRTQL